MMGVILQVFPSCPLWLDQAKNNKKHGKYVCFVITTNYLKIKSKLSTNLPFPHQGWFQQHPDLVVSTGRL